MTETLTGLLSCTAELEPSSSSKPKQNCEDELGGCHWIIFCSLKYNPIKDIFSSPLLILSFAFPDKDV